MKRRKFIYDYGRRYHNGKFLGWEVWKVTPKEDVSGAVATFYGKKAKTHAKVFTKEMNLEIIN